MTLRAFGPLDGKGNDSFYLFSVLFFLSFLGCVGKTYSNPSSGDTTGDRSPGQTRKKPKDLSAREREDHGCGEGEGVYVVCMCE